MAAFSTKTREEYEEEWFGKVNNSTLKLRDFFGRFDLVKRQVTDTFVDGQRTLKGRTELLEQVSGYCNLVMDKNWNVQGGGLNGFARALPFNSVMGPDPKNASHFYGRFHGTGDDRHGILLEKQGTWRLDTRVTIRGGATEQLGNLFLTAWNRDTKTIYSEAPYATRVYTTDRTHAFHHTIIVPPELAGKIVVCTSLGHESFRRTVLGGDRFSSLSVNRWDLDSSGVAPDPGDVGNGGDYD
ncbi:hypothetical protein [Rhodococcus globerulus]|uniref:Uncharacterized protein n=1 Tax=Rhodococcus globerulus TaxID=33008 RepID=A0ABU4BS96_RHOGO|nr:hypothetical protein [Rhodococcus globerulus]MDV6267088.1 hypothetical protein [Rhodococcus globerulus]